MKEEYVTVSLVRKVHELVFEEVHFGEAVIDATVGNGYDTLFLAECVGVSGRVIGFDLQGKALENTKKRLFDAGVSEVKIELYEETHSRMKEYVTEEVAAVLFNLGYLPGGDKSKITQEVTTLQALDQAWSLLRKKGILSVMCYPGHPGGDSEAEAVLRWMRDLEREGLQKKTLPHQVTHYRAKVENTKAPFLLLAQKEGGLLF